MTSSCRSCRRHIYMALRIFCKYKLYCASQCTGQLKSSQRTRGLFKKRKHKCGDRTYPYLSMNVITWPSPDMAVSEVIMIIFDDWVKVLFDFNYNFMFSKSRRVLRKVLWQPDFKFIFKVIRIEIFCADPQCFRYCKS